MSYRSIIKDIQNKSNGGGDRYEYIDILKGFTIIWVLWMHMDLPEFIYPSVQMPIFFFLSGTLYHAKKPTLWQQVKSDAYKLLLPTTVFSMLAFIISFIQGKLVIDGVFSIVKQCLSASIVWFLLALFYFRTIAYPCVKKQKQIFVLLIALLIYIPGFYLYANGCYWILPFFPLSHMGTFMIWFAIGVLYGEYILKLITSHSLYTKRVLVILTIVYILLVHCLDWDFGLLSYIPWLAYGFPYTLGVIFVMLLAAYYLNQLRFFSILTNILAYVGRNSIVFYLTHWPLWMYVFKPLNLNIYVSFTLIVLLEFPLIYLFNHYLPWCIGKTYKNNL